MQSLYEFESWLNAHIPEVVSDLRTGATEAELQDLSLGLGLSLPDDFLQLYTWHNGQEGNINTGPWYGLTFLPLDQVGRECETWRQVLVDSSPESLGSLASNATSTPAGFVKKQYAGTGWVPFAHDHAGNYLGVDLCPDAKGTYGQVINFGRHEERKIAVAPNLGAFVSWMLNELRTGNFNIRDEDDGGRSFNTLRPQKLHFLDSLAVMFPDTDSYAPKKDTKSPWWRFW
jgi:cell wall assembly regulator SMI1